MEDNWTCLKCHKKFDRIKYKDCPHQCWRCNQCELENNTGRCDRKDCKNYKEWCER